MSDTVSDSAESREMPTMFERREQSFNRFTVYDMTATRKYSKNNKKSGSNRSSAGRTPPRKIEHAPHVHNAGSVQMRDIQCRGRRLMKHKLHAGDARIF